MAAEYGEIDFAQASARYRAERFARAAEPAAARDLRHARRSTRSARSERCATRALRHCFERIVYEQAASRGQGLSPVNGAPELPGAVRRRRHPALRLVAGRDGVVEVGGRGRGHPLLPARTRPRGTRRSRMRAMLDSPARVVAGPTPTAALKQAYGWLRDAQMQERAAAGTTPSGASRSSAAGASPTARTAGRCRDCTAEAMTALLEAHDVDGLDQRRRARISDARLEQAARFILRRQNDDGGFGSYESRRGSAILEYINPSEMYGNCMTERSYTECTASCVGALARFRARYPATLRDATRRADRARRRALALAPARRRLVSRLLGRQLHLRHLPRRRGAARRRRAGVRSGDRARRRVAAHKQKRDGGWGEHWKSCLTDTLRRASRERRRR